MEVFKSSLLSLFSKALSFGQDNLPRSRNDIPNSGNPDNFNLTRTIQFAVRSSGFVVLNVYDVLGRVVKTLVNSRLTPGEHSVVFDGRGLASGVYFYSLSNGQNVERRKMLLLK